MGVEKLFDNIAQKKDNGLSNKLYNQNSTILRRLQNNHFTRFLYGITLAAVLTSCSGGSGKKDDPVDPCMYQNAHIEQMDDGNPCTNDYCDAGVVKHNPQPYSQTKTCPSPQDYCDAGQRVTTPSSVQDTCSGTTYVHGDCAVETKVADPTVIL